MIFLALYAMLWQRPVLDDLTVTENSPRWAAAAKQREDAAGKQHEYRARLDLQRRYQEVLEALGQYETALDVFAKQYNGDGGAQWPLRESGDLERKMERLQKSWRSLQDCEGWISTKKK